MSISHLFPRTAPVVKNSTASNGLPEDATNPSSPQVLLTPRIRDGDRSEWSGLGKISKSLMILESEDLTNDK